MGRAGSTLALLVVAVGLGFYIFVVEADRPPADAPATLEPVFEVESGDIATLTVVAEDGQRTVLEKREDRWQLVEPLTSNVDVTEVVALTSGLASLELQRVVSEPEDSPDLSQFGLAPPRLAVGFQTPELDTRLLIGELTPTGGDLYATIEGSDRVFLISGYLDGTFNRTTFDLRDKTILDITQNQVDGLEVTGEGLAVRLRKANNAWSLVEPFEAHADLGVADGLVGRLSTGQMTTIAAEETDDLSAYGLDAPRLTVTVNLGASAATLLIGDTLPDGAVYARDTARELVFTVDGSLADELAQEAQAYRRKNLFAFRPFNASRLEVHRDGTRQAFERVEAASDQDDTVWRRVEPDPAEVDAAGLEDLLAQLSNLRAETFVESRDGTGLDAPLATVVVTFDDPAVEERVSVGRVGDEVFAVSGDETGAARLDTRAWEEALAALSLL